MPFTTDWFSNNIKRWETYVKPFLLKIQGRANILDIAPYEGRSTCWLLDNIPRCKVTILQPSTNHRVLQNMEKNLAVYGDRVKVIHGDIGILKKIKEDSFDFIYIDMGADARYELKAAVLAFDLLKPKGMMVFDDYTIDHLHSRASCPKSAIDAFLDHYARFLKVIHTSWQVILLKRTKPLSIPRCKSEYYHENLNKI